MPLFLNNTEEKDMHIANLAKKNQKILETEIKSDDFAPECLIRFWDKSTVSLDGDMSLEELKRLAEVMGKFT